MNPATQYTIAFIAGRLANPSATSWAVSAPEGTKYFGGSQVITPTEINIEDSQTRAHIQGSGSGTLRIRGAGETEDFELTMSGQNFSGRTGSESFSGSVSSTRVTVNNQEYYLR